MTADAAIIVGDMRATLADMPADSIDACVTDCPYELSFMGKKWDGTGISFDPATWAAVFRVLKPGSHLLCFGGTRTVHRIACAIEDAGFEIRDQIAWMYGTGFPKSLNLPGGLGTALKPAMEPIVVARKPLIGTVAGNVQEYGTGALNVEGCRIGWQSDADRAAGRPASSPRAHNGIDGVAFKIADRSHRDPAAEQSSAGRWPANVILDPEAARLLDLQSGESGSAFRMTGADEGRADERSWRLKPTAGTVRAHGDSGGASRFFYVAKPDRRERDIGCESLPAKTGAELTGRKPGSPGSKHARASQVGGGRNTHATVKPVDLMRYLCRLVCPPGGTVLDPFAGSGTTGIAAHLEGFGFIGIELRAEAAQIARLRISATQRGELYVDKKTDKTEHRQATDNRQQGLFA